MTDETQRPRRPWYREIWPWLLMLPPAASVAGGVTMVLLATNTPSALVVDDYARIEELTSERFDRDRRAAEYGVEANVTIDRDRGRAVVSLSGPAGLPRPRAVLMNLQHAANPAADRALELIWNGEAFVSPVELAAGVYRVELMPDDRGWRLGGEVTRYGAEITLTPQLVPRRQR